MHYYKIKKEGRTWLKYLQHEYIGTTTRKRK